MRPSLLTKTQPGLKCRISLYFSNVRFCVTVFKIAFLLWWQNKTKFVFKVEELNILIRTMTCSHCKRTLPAFRYHIQPTLTCHQPLEAL